MSHHSLERLTTKQLEAVRLLASGKSATTIAHLLDLRRETLSRWRKVPAFAAEYERLMEGMRSEMAPRLTQLVHRSIAALYDEIDGRAKCDHARVRAAINVLKLLKAESLLAQNAAQGFEPTHKPG